MATERSAILSHQLVSNCKALGSDRRLSILVFLRPKERNVKEIASWLHVTSPAASFHLRKLRKDGYVEANRLGQETFYRVTGTLRTSPIYRKILRKCEEEIKNVLIV